MTDSKAALVFGASGIIGRGFLRHLDGLNDWDITGVMRNPPNFDTRAEHLSVDLTDRDASLSGLRDVPEITHVFYTAYQDYPTWEAAAEPNTEMFKNAMDGLLQNAPNLEHVQILQGAKYYGRHLGPYKKHPLKRMIHGTCRRASTSGKRIIFANSRSDGRGTGQPYVRKRCVASRSATPLNLTSVVAVYAAISKELGLPLRWPGKPEAFYTIYQVTDYDILGKSMVWAATTPACANEVIQCHQWRRFTAGKHMWGRIAEYFDMEAGPPQQINLAQMMADKETALGRNRREARAWRQHPSTRRRNWAFGDYAFSSDWDVCMDTTKCRRAGFLDFIDTEEMFINQFDELRKAKIIP